MKDFKIGDRVRYTDTRVGDAFNSRLAGKVGTVIGSDNEGCRLAWDSLEPVGGAYKYNLIPLNNKQATLRLIKKYL